MSRKEKANDSDLVAMATLLFLNTTVYLSRVKCEQLIKMMLAT